ncbi:hypothetical protein FIBSPDRAFT_1046829 [Athelia psychrophila]|uniref:F-box domain-containing protein n=1 Tax=Athelia psychrophila TaxID=1759441 RepID=A0A166G673_9AGAM|nr:hypothetical protein FIBSPDRAFT_1046829 [Fibularhizoctonia sp. CBS 109695]
MASGTQCLQCFGPNLASLLKAAMDRAASSPFSEPIDTTLLPSHIVASPLSMALSHFAIPYLKSQLDSIEVVDAPTKGLLEHLELVRQCCRRERRGVLRRLRDHQSIVAPIRRVPDDILVEIFSAFMNTSGYHYQPDPITLTSVCGRWRALAHSTPRLWSQITIFLTPLNHLSMGNLIHHYTSLSATRPLQLSLTPKDDMSSTPAVKLTLGADGIDRDDDDDKLFVEALAASATRWRTITVTPSTLEFLYRAWDTDESDRWDLPLLETLEIDYYPDTNWGDDIYIYDITAPRLRRLICPDRSCEPFIPMELPWDQIEELDGFSLHFRDFVTFLGRSPKLRRWHSLGLVYNDFDDAPETIEDFKHQLIRSIDAKMGRREELEMLFTHLQFPSLVELRMSGSNWHFSSSFWSQYHFSMFLSNSSCVLQRLALDSFIVSRDDLPLILESVPSVSEFQFAESAQVYTEAEAVFDTRIVERLTIHQLSSDTDSNSILLPRLRTMSLMGGLLFDTRVFNAMIKSRILHTRDLPSTFHSLYLQMEVQDDLETSIRTRGRTAENYEPPLNVRDFEELKDILHERAYISGAVRTTQPNLAFPHPL